MTTRRKLGRLAGCLLAATASVALVLQRTDAAAGTGAEADALVAKLAAVGKDGAGNAEAATAWKAVVRQGTSALPALFAGLDKADARGANWIRTAVEAIADGELTAGRTLPVDVLTAHAADRKRGGPGRKLAFEWLRRVDAAGAAKLLPGFADDPAPEMRREGVALLITDATAAAKADPAKGLAVWAGVLVAARDTDQIETAARELEKLGVRVDTGRQLGCLRRWFVLGPLDGPGTTGFGTEYDLDAVKTAVDFEKGFKGKAGAEITWKEVTTGAPDAAVDLNKVLGKHKGAVAYVVAPVMSDAERDVVIKLGSPNAVRVRLNGVELFAFEEYHHGAGPDQYVCRGKLKAGRNDIVVKVCQNEQTEFWAQEWTVQLRVLDATATPVPLKPWVPEKKRN